MIETPPVEDDFEVYEFWWQAVPRWLWLLAGGMLLLFVVSITVRLACADSPVRFWWTVGQMALGFIAFCVAHLLAYMYGAAQSDRVGPLDALIKPLGTWHPVLFSLPKTCKIVCTGAWSLAAIVLAFFLIDGIDFDALAESRKQEAVQNRKRRTNPMAYVIKSAQLMAKAQGHSLDPQSQPESLEEALGAFTGEAGILEGEMGLLGESAGDDFHDPHGQFADFSGENGLDPEAYIAQQQRLLMGATSFTGTGGPPFCPGVPGCPPHGKGPVPFHPGGNSPGSVEPRTNPSPPSDTQSIVRSESIECVVFGYTTNIEGEPRSLLLAAPEGSHLRFVAKVSFDDVAPDVAQQMTGRFSSLHQRWPVVRSPYGGRWLKPELFCEVEFSGWTLNGRLSDPYVTRLAVLATPEHVDSDFTSVRE
jgi:hypothetical protein